MSSARRRLVVALLVVLSVTRSVTAAASPSRVVVVRAADASALVDEATMRLRGELTASGFEVITVDQKPGVSPRDAVEGAELRPVATLSIVSTDRGAAIDVWVADHLTGKTLVRRIDVEPAHAAEAPKLLAVRAAELLRASLLEAAHPPPETPVSPLPADVERWVKARRAESKPPGGREGSPGGREGSSARREGSSARREGSPARREGSPASPPNEAVDPPVEDQTDDAMEPGRFSFGLGAAAIYHFDNNAPSFGPELTLAYRFTPRLRGALYVLGPAFGPTLERGSGSLAAREELALGEVTYALLPSGGFIPSLSFGLGALHAFIEGSAEPPSVAGSGDYVFFLAGAGVSAQVALTTRVSLHLGARALGALPSAVYRIEGEEVGGIGRVNLAGSLGVTVTP